MNKFIATGVAVVFACFIITLCAAYPSYKHDYPDNYHGYHDYDGYGYGYERNHKYWLGPPRFGSGYDYYTYGPYTGHPGPYDYYGHIYKSYHGKDYNYDSKPYGYNKDHHYDYGYTHEKY